MVAKTRKRSDMFTNPNRPAVRPLGKLPLSPSRKVKLERAMKDLKDAYGREPR